MKTAFIFVFCFLLNSGLAITKEEEKEIQKTNYRNAKALCLMNDTLLRGKRLKECIEKQMEKNRREALEAKVKAKLTP